MNFDLSKVIAYLSQGCAASVVIEFISETIADNAFEIARTKTLSWSISSAYTPDVLKLTHGESRAVAAMGQALRVVLREAQEVILPNKPDGAKVTLITHRPRGLLQISIDGRIFPIFQVEEKEEQLFYFGELRCRFTRPEWITEAMIIEVKRRASNQDPLGK